MIESLIAVLIEFKQKYFQIIRAIIIQYKPTSLSVSLVVLFKCAVICASS